MDIIGGKQLQTHTWRYPKKEISKLTKVKEDYSNIWRNEKPNKFLKTALQSLIKTKGQLDSTFQICFFIMMMKNYFFGMFDRRKALSHISTPNHCQRFLTSQSLTYCVYDFNLLSLTWMMITTTFVGFSNQCIFLRFFEIGNASQNIGKKKKRRRTEKMKNGFGFLHIFENLISLPVVNKNILPTFVYI